MRAEHLTIAYLTSRKQPMIEWFFDSLHRETEGNYDGIKIVVVDFWANDRGTDFASKATHFVPGLVHVTPKPSVWQGKHRLTKADYFAAANARNTALCHAPDGWIAFVDDLSVLMPGWLASVREAMAGNYIVCGAYRKVNKLAVSNGFVLGFEDNPSGHDGRWWKGSNTTAVDCSQWPEWSYGASLCAPVESFLTIGGWPEICDSNGGEDSCTGFMLANNRWRPATGFFYDRRMLTYESEELHAQLPRFLREDPCKGDPDAKPRDDMSHAMLRVLKNRTAHPGFFGDEGIRGLRQRILSGEPFPIVGIPEHRWFDHAKLSDLPDGVAPNVILPYYDANDAKTHRH